MVETILPKNNKTPYKFMKKCLKKDYFVGFEQQNW